MKVAFSDFWWKFDNKNNFFIDSLRELRHDIILVDDITEADLLIFSCFGNQHKLVDRNKTKKIYFTGEDLRPPLDECDYSLTFDHSNYEGKNFRLPLWMLQIDWWKTEGFNYVNPQYVIPFQNLKEPQFVNRQQFCCTIFNRDQTGLRYKTLEKLQQYKDVYCFGEPWKNWFYGEDKKLSILSNFTFTLCYENSSSEGYYTEKPIHARVAGCIPIYWSHKNYSSDFNSKAFINLCDYGDIKELVEKVIEVDMSPLLKKEMIEQPIFAKEPEINSYMSFMKTILDSI